VHPGPLNNMAKLKASYAASFIGCAVLGMVAATFWPHSLALARLVLLADAVVTILILFRQAIRNEALLILYLLLSYYIFPFPVNVFFGGLDALGVTIVQTLGDRGFQFPEDTIMYSNLLVVFKNVLMLGCLGIAARHSSWENEREDRLEHWVAIGALLVVLVSLRMFINHAFLDIALTFLAIYAAASIAGRVVQKTGFSVAWGVALLATMAGISVILTRSREPIALVFLYVLFLYGRRFRMRSWQVGGFLLFGLFLVVAYGAVREGASAFANVGLVGFEALGESGNMHLIGGHVVGLTDRNLLPSELREDVLDKLLRSVPFIPKGDMLADRYVGVFYPTIAQEGGGFAYPVVAELFTVAYLPGVVAGAFLIGTLVKMLLLRARSTFELVAFFFIFLGLVRRETVLTAITALSVVAVWLALRAVVTLLREATRKPKPSAIDAFKRGDPRVPT